MAKIANTVQTYDRVGIREELADTIYDISPTKTPFLNNAGRGSVVSTFPEWQTDSLEDVDPANAQIEGNDYTTFDAIAPTSRLGNRTQISAKTIIVSRTAERTKKAGRKSEMKYQTARKMKALKRDIETIALSNQASDAATDSTARKTGSFTAFLVTNVDKAGDGTNPVYTTEPDDTYTDGTPRNFSETIVKNVMESCYTNGAEPTTMMVGPKNKVNFSSFPGIAEIRKAVNGRSMADIIGAADFYVSDFGDLAVIPNRFMRTSEALFIDWKYVKISYFDPFDLQDLAKTGDATKKLLITEWCVQVMNEAAHGIARDLTNTVNGS